MKPHLQNVLTRHFLCILIFLNSSIPTIFYLIRLKPQIYLHLLYFLIFFLESFLFFLNIMKENYMFYHFRITFLSDLDFKVFHQLFSNNFPFPLRQYHTHQIIITSFSFIIGLIFSLKFILMPQLML